MSMIEQVAAAMSPKDRRDASAFSNDLIALLDRFVADEDRGRRLKRKLLTVLGVSVDMAVTSTLDLLVRGMPAESVLLFVTEHVERVASIFSLSHGSSWPGQGVVKAAAEAILGRLQASDPPDLPETQSPVSRETVH